ncbi:hypothetical protein vseg_006559 [Gypsophila vaccaria]
MYEILPKIISSPNSNNSSKLIASSPNQQQIPHEFLNVAIFAAGSFREIEAAYGHINGVIKTSTGYFGGNLNNPSFKQVCAGESGHTEAVKVVYDGRLISFSSLCDIFWNAHDPTNKKFLNFGLNTHQRSVIFYSTEEERKEAQESKIRRQMKLNKRIVTKILSRNNCEFFLAENQHQKYYLQKHHMLCASLGLRSRLHFVDSNIACTLNGILGMNEEEKIISELVYFMNIQEIPCTAKRDCQEIIEDLRTSTKNRI